MNGEIDQILYSWLSEFPKGHVPKDNDMRLEAFKDLFLRFKAKGIVKDDIRSGTIGRIVTETINPNLPNKTKRRHWAELNNKLIKMALHSVYTEAVTQEANPLDSSVPAKELKEVSIEEIVEEHNSEIDFNGNTVPKEPKLPLVEHFADTEGPPAASVNVIDPEMAELLGIKVR